MYVICLATAAFPSALPKRLTVGGLLVALCVAACAPAHSVASTPSGPEPIPWLPLSASSPPPEPSPQPVPVPPGTPKCRASQLAGAVVGSNGATGHVLTSLGFTDTTPTPCFVDGTPSVTLVDAAGHTLSFPVRSPYAPSTIAGPVLLEPGPLPSPYSGPQVGRAYLYIDWDSQPEPCPGDHAVVPARALVGIAGSGTVIVDIPPEPGGYTCQGLGVSNFTGPPVPAPPTPVSAPMPSVSIDAPSSVKAGTTLFYRVVLHNDSAEAIDLVGDCPNYEEGLVRGAAPAAGKGFYALNCTAARTIPAGK